MEPVILVADPKDRDYLRLKGAFEALDHKCRLERAREGGAVISYLLGEHQFGDRERFPFPDLLILEMDLSPKDGLDVLRWLRRETSIGPLPALMLSARAELSQIRAAYEMGAVSFLRKPDSDRAYHALAAALAEYWFVWNTPSSARFATLPAKTSTDRQLLQTAVLTISDPRGNWDYGWKLICEAAELDPLKVVPPFRNRTDEDLKRATWDSLPNLTADNAEAAPNQE